MVNYTVIIDNELILSLCDENQTVNEFIFIWGNHIICHSNVYEDLMRNLDELIETTTKICNV